MRVLILGASGMLGNAMLKVLAETSELEVFGTVRSSSALDFFVPTLRTHIIDGIDVENQDSLVKVFSYVKPHAVVNCVGLVKQLAGSQDPLLVLPINAMLPHRLSRLCDLSGARLIHISTDCVFSGLKGNYIETDLSDATDLYGKSKFLGEVSYPNTVTLRTSIIGHEFASTHGLISWFLSQTGQVKGYTHAVFSGLPTVELARIVRDIVLPKSELSGLYHVASTPITKYELLKLVASVYSKAIDIIPDGALMIDRSLNADRFHAATGYIPPSWPELVTNMFEFK